LIDDTAVNKIGVMTDNVARELHVALVSCESMAKMTVVSADRVLPNLRRDLVRLESRDLQSSGPAGQDPKASKPGTDQTTGRCRCLTNLSTRTSLSKPSLRPSFGASTGDDLIVGRPSHQ
jgi:hypothetical protein